MLGALGIVGWVIFRASLGKMLTLIHRKRTLGCFLFEGRGSGLRGVFAGHWCEHRVPLRLPGWMTVNPPSLGPGAAAPRSQTSPPPEVMPSVLPLIKAAFQARKKKKKKKNFIAVMLDLLRVDRPWSGAAPASPNAAESLVGNVGFSTCWGGAGQAILA